MKKVYILYNPKSGKGTGETESKKLQKNNTVYTDITTITDYREIFAQLNSEDEVVVAGGDGTLNRFAYDVSDLEIKNRIYYYSTGSGNDFLNDLNKIKGDEPFDITEYLENLPVITVNGKEYRFINGVGGGLDAYSCEEVNKLHNRGKEGNYVATAIKGILYDYAPMNAVIKVDGVEYQFSKVWFASVMKGRYFGGGIMLAPNQDRKSHKLSVVVVHTVGKLKLLTIVPGAFKGKHVKYKQFVKVIEGNNIEVEFDRPVPLQIDGETISSVTSYSVKMTKGARI